MNNKLAIVIPCFNEEAVLKETVSRILALLDTLVIKKIIAEDSYVLFVDDGSKDKTWDIISGSHHTDSRVKGISLSCNVGHQYALWAGLNALSDGADMIISLDADLQDDINVMQTMIERYNDGCDVVYGVRRDRGNDTIIKKYTALCFYGLMRFLGTDTVYNHADYRLLSRRALKYLLEFKESNLFIRGIVPLLGFKSDKVFYNRAARYAGDSKYPLRKMLEFAIEGITSFSVKPIRLIAILGIIFLLVALAVLTWTVYSYFIGSTVAGWSSLMLSIWFCSGCLLVSLSIVGEYIGKIYTESKARPKYYIMTSLL